MARSNNNRAAQTGQVCIVACLPRELRGLLIVGMRRRHPGGAEVGSAPAEAADELVALGDLLLHLQYGFGNAVRDKWLTGSGRKD